MFSQLKVPFQHENIVGRISELLTEREADGLGIAVIEAFVVAATHHERLAMPYLVRRRVDPTFVIVNTTVFLHCCYHQLLLLITTFQDIEFDFNAQHDCLFAGCGPTGKRPCVQERIESSEVTESFVEHCDVPRWIINMHSLHNGHLLRRCLPQDLILPIPVIDPAKREEEHRKVATAQRPKQDAKRAEANKKRAAKRQKVEVVGNSKVSGKREAGLGRGKAVEDDVAMSDE